MAEARQYSGNNLTTLHPAQTRNHKCTNKALGWLPTSGPGPRVSPGIPMALSPRQQYWLGAALIIRQLWPWGRYLYIMLSVCAARWNI